MLNISPFSLSLPLSFSFKFFLSYFIFLPDVSIPINTVFIIYLVSLSLLLCFSVSAIPTCYTFSLSRFSFCRSRIVFLSYRDTIHLTARRESNTYMDSALCDGLLNRDITIWHIHFCISTAQSRHLNIKKILLLMEWNN